ncbi:hypothetical protein BCT23_19860 [Enterovibrio norvegicus]|uniref:Uncharacterized protein n=1 Tax=Enterovibrio norvegicus TaxID=188144 RepID=A0A2N7L8J1_9GAMM|nr:hypothetical protein BCT23_19860 [Enterovibrio norvegicus]
MPDLGVTTCFYKGIMERIKCSRERMQQNEVFSHTSRSALENLCKTLDIRMVTLAFASTKWGNFELANVANSKVDKSLSSK